MALSPAREFLYPQLPVLTKESEQLRATRSARTSSSIASPSLDLA